jgi:hypothetical protein
MQDLSDQLIYLIPKQLVTTMGCMFEHIHLDNKYIQHTLPIKGQNAMLSYLDFSIVTMCIYIYK